MSLQIVKLFSLGQKYMYHTFIGLTFHVSARYISMSNCRVLYSAIWQTLRIFISTFHCNQYIDRIPFRVFFLIWKRCPLKLHLNWFLFELIWLWCVWSAIKWQEREKRFKIEYQQNIESKLGDNESCQRVFERWEWKV